MAMVEYHASLGEILDGWTFSQLYRVFEARGRRITRENDRQETQRRKSENIGTVVDDLDPEDLKRQYLEEAEARGDTAAVERLKRKIEMQQGGVGGMQTSVTKVT